MATLTISVSGGVRKHNDRFRKVHRNIHAKFDAETLNGMQVTFKENMFLNRLVTLAIGCLGEVRN